MEPITKDELAALRALCEAICPSEPMEYLIDCDWRRDGEHIIRHTGNGQVVIRQSCNSENPQFDGMLAGYYRLFAASRAALPRLLDEVERLNTESAEGLECARQLADYVELLQKADAEIERLTGLSEEIGRLLDRDDVRAIREETP